MIGYAGKKWSWLFTVIYFRKLQDYELTPFLWEPSRASKFIYRFSRLNCFKKFKHKPLKQWCVCNLKIMSSLEGPTDLENKVYLKQAD